MPGTAPRRAAAQSLRTIGGTAWLSAATSRPATAASASGSSAATSEYGTSRAPAVIVFARYTRCSFTRSPWRRATSAARRARSSSTSPLAVSSWRAPAAGRARRRRPRSSRERASPSAVASSVPGASGGRGRRQDDVRAALLAERPLQDGERHEGGPHRGRAGPQRELAEARSRHDAANGEPQRPRRVVAAAEERARRDVGGRLQAHQDRVPGGGAELLRERLAHERLAAGAERRRVEALEGPEAVVDAVDAHVAGPPPGRRVRRRRRRGRRGERHP